MAALASTGVGSGLDVNGIVTQLVAVEKAPLTALQTKATTIQSQISAWGKVQSQLDAVRSAATKLASASNWSTTQVTASDTTVVSAGAASVGSAAAGRYSLSVSQLAQEATLASGAIATGANLTGQLRIELGTYDGALPPGFTARSGSTAIDLNFTDPNTTLGDVRDAINAAAAGVTASIVTDAAGQRLVISSSDTGADRSLRTTVTGGSVGGLNGLAYDGSGASTLTQTRAAKDAQFSINGLSLTSASNTLDGTVQGLKLQLLKTTTSAVDITVSSDTASQRKLIDEFVSAYNAVNSQIATTTAYDAANKKAGLLQGDATTLGVSRVLREAVGLNGTASSTFSRLSDLGIDILRDGSMSVNSTKLTTALTNSKELAKFFTTGTGTTATDAATGLGVRLKNLTDQLLGSEGSVASKTASLKTRQTSNQSDQDRLNAKVENTRQRLLRQYQALDAKMSQLNGLGSYITQQFTTK